MVFVQIEEDLALDPEHQPDAIEDVLRYAAEVTLQTASAPGVPDLTVVLTGDEQVQALNLQFLQIDAPTDVLSFPDGTVDEDSGETYLGDVIIAYPTARQQAAAGGHALQAELQLLVVHGVLHLLGYDHAEPAEKEAMWAVQSAALGRLGNPLSPP